MSTSGPSTSSSSKKRPAPSSHPKQPYKIRKLTPTRPFPVVSLASSSTGPRSALKEGKNEICISRRTPLAVYLRRCKQLLVDEGYPMVRLHAMGAAIPHLALLATSLPSILPFPPGELLQEITTGTTEVHDEIIPDDEDEDISQRSRQKSTLQVIFRVRKSMAAEATIDKGKALSKSRGKQRRKEERRARNIEEEVIVMGEPDQEDEDGMDVG